MAQKDITKTLKLNVESNLEKFLKTNMDKSNQLSKTLNALTRKIKESSVTTTSELMKALKLTQKRLELENKAAKQRLDTERQILNLQNKYARQASESRRNTAQFTESLKMLSRKDLLGAVKSNINFGIEKRARAQKEAVETRKNMQLDASRKYLMDEQTKIRSKYAAQRTEAQKADVRLSQLDKEIKARNLMLTPVAQGGVGKPVTGLDGKKMTVDFSEREKARLTKELQDLQLEKRSLRGKRNMLGSYETISAKEAAELNAASQAAVSRSTDIEGQAMIDAADIENAADLKAAGVEMAFSAVKKTGQFIWNTAKKIAGTFNNMLKTTLGISFNIKDIFRGIAQNIAEILDMKTGAATYSTSTSLITNTAAREQQMKYGLSEAQNYALSQTMGMMNMRSDDDLMYMNREQITLFRSFMAKYDAWYSEMQSSGVLRDIQIMQMDLQMFKQELAMDFLKWFAENKDTLMAAIKTIAQIIMKLMTIVAKIFERLGGGLFGGSKNSEYTSLAGSSVMSDYLNNSNNNNSRSYNVNINQSNNATGVLSNQSQLEAFFNDQMVKLSQDLATELA